MCRVCDCNFVLPTLLNFKIDFPVQNTKYKMALTTALTLFSASLVPDEDFEERGKAACHQIFEILRLHRNDVAEVKISGSMGKRTAVSFPGLDEPDFDVVIFLNIPNLDDFTQPENGPPFRNILLQFLAVFKYHSKEITILNSAAPNFLRIQVDGIKVDVSPAIFFKNDQSFFGSGLTREEFQKNKITQLIQNLENPVKFGYYYTPGLTEASAGYVKSEAARINAHPLIRLAKFWNRNLQLPQHVKYVTGRSYLVERMALHAAQQLELEDDYDLFSGLEKFLQLMSVFRELVIHKPQAPRFAYHMQQENPHGRPVVMDPVNPYCNLAQLNHSYGARREIINCFEEGAQHCLDKLKIVKWRETQSGSRWHLQSVDHVKNILDQSVLVLPHSDGLILTPIKIFRVPLQSSLPSSFSFKPESACRSETKEQQPGNQHQRATKDEDPIAMFFDDVVLLLKLFAPLLFLEILKILEKLIAGICFTIAVILGILVVAICFMILLAFIVAFLKALSGKPI